MARLIFGHTTDTSITVWVRASSRWPVAFIEVLDKSTNTPVQAMVTFSPIECRESEFFCAVYKCEGLTPDTAYRVKVSFGKHKKALPDERIRDDYTEGVIRTFPVQHGQADFSFVLGSCNLHSLGIFQRPDQAWIEISRIAKNNNARFMLHCGDQIYADIPFRPSADIQHFRDKYLDAWDDCKPARKVLTELPHYMIMDDHEIIDNFDNSQKFLFLNKAGLLNAALKAYWEFQHMHNPASPAGDYAYHYSFSYGNACFFVMDTRTRRDARTGEMIDSLQENILLQWLSENKAKLKFIVTSVPFVAEVRSSDKDKWCDSQFDDQRGRILKHILDNAISKVVFLTGDMHTSYHAIMQVAAHGKTVTIHELMSSPINQVTPDTILERHYHQALSKNLQGMTLTSTIDPNSYFAKHSNVMVINVEHQPAGQKISYKIFRTTETMNGPQGAFTV